MTDRQLADRIAVVTGGAGGIGRIIALRCATEGATVVLAARSVDALESVAAEISCARGHALVVPTDVRSVGDVTRLRETVEREVGPADVLVNCCGVPGPTKPLWEIDPFEWKETLDVNLTGVFLCCQAFLPSMIARRRGSVIVIGSATGKRPLYGRTPYAASKLALVGLVRTLAWEVGPHNVRVNLISPGATDGDRIQSVIRAQAAARSTSEDAARAEFTAASALDRFVDPAHIAAAVSYLASDAAGSTTGEDLNVSAGMVMY